MSPIFSEIQSEELVEKLREDVPRDVAAVPAIAVADNVIVPEIDADFALALQLQQEFDRERAELEISKAETRHQAQYTKVVLDSEILHSGAAVPPRVQHRWDAETAEGCSDDEDSDEEDDVEDDEDEDDEEANESGSVVWKTKHDAAICGLRNTEYLEETHPQHNLGNLENIKVTKSLMGRNGFFFLMACFFSDEQPCVQQHDAARGAL